MKMMKVKSHSTKLSNEHLLRLRSPLVCNNLMWLGEYLYQCFPQSEFSMFSVCFNYVITGIGHGDKHP